MTAARDRSPSGAEGGFSLWLDPFLRIGDIKYRDWFGCSAPMRKARFRTGLLYWICQLGGWLSYALMCTFSSWLMEGHLYVYLVGNIVSASCGLIITHLFRWFIARRRWLDLPLASLIVRVALAVPLLALAFAGSFYLTAPLYSYLLHRAGPFDLVHQHPIYLLLGFADSLLVFGSWASIYIGFHFLKQRRRGDQESWRLTTALSRARLDALRAQENPHFVCNALNRLRGLIDERSPDTQEALTRLASVLRYFQASDANTTVLFGTELGVVMDYLELESLRFEDRLIVRKQVQPEVLDRPISRMLLQTLVENAVKYGVSQNPGICELSIFAAIDPVDGRLCIRVDNTGHLRMDESNSKGAGLRNARERLRRLFGNDAELKIAENPPGLVTAAVFVPNRQPTVALPSS
jgi:two-component system LytT family sensor kinase